MIPRLLLQVAFVVLGCCFVFYEDVMLHIFGTDAASRNVPTTRTPISVILFPPMPVTSIGFWMILTGAVLYAYFLLIRRDFAFHQGMF